MRKRIAIICSIILSFFIGAAGMYLLIQYVPNDTIRTVFRDTKNVTITSSDSISESVDKLNSAVVVVQTLSNVQQVGSGTGFVYKVDDKKGYIITNNHVVSGGNKFNIILPNGNNAEATLLGGDVYADIAVLSIDKDYVTGVASIGKSSDIKVGDTVFTIGAPISDEYSGTVTKGIISGKDRMVSVNLGNNVGDYMMNVIQTDAAINPGNSGGALLNMNGEVIGINSSKFASTKVEGMGYAIPITQVENIITELMSRETREKVDEDKVGYLGVGCQDVDPQTVYFYNIEGALVTEVYEGTPAYKAGIKPNQIIVGLDGQSVTSASDLVEKLQYYSFGEKVDVVVAYFDGDEYKEKTIKIRLARRPRD